eukprot:scaffold3342_cov174-Amphora_coffeaeformis.AAC.13
MVGTTNEHIQCWQPRVFHSNFKTNPVSPVVFRPTHNGPCHPLSLAALLVEQYYVSAILTSKTDSPEQTSSLHKMAMVPVAYTTFLPRSC